MSERLPKQVQHMQELIRVSDTTCVQQLRMDRNAFGRLCYLLENVGNLCRTRNILVSEQVAVFLNVLSHHKKNAVVKHDFRRSGQTISKIFHNVLNAIIRLYPLLFVQPKPVDEDNDDWRWKWFKGCLGALDGTHIPVRVPLRLQPRYINRKRVVSVNVLGVCNVEMNFSYVLVGWEGSAADSRVLRDAVARTSDLRIPTEMAPAPKKGGMGAPINARRIWTFEEESALIQGLKDLVARGWKCDNGFRSGYMGILEHHMNLMFPGTDIKAEPHISSKITVWKKFYIEIVPMMGTSGFGWTESGYMLDVKDDIWDAWIKVHPKAKPCRGKSFPFYYDWVEIFGKDRATGEGAMGFADAVNNVLHNTGEVPPNNNERPDGVASQLEPEDNDMYSTSVHGGGGESSASGKAKTSGKRKRNVDLDSQVVGMLSTLCEKTQEHMSQLVAAVGFQRDSKEQRKNVFKELSSISTLTTTEKFKVAKYLCKNAEQLDLFFSLSHDDKVSMVRLILEEKF